MVPCRDQNDDWSAEWSEASCVRRANVPLGRTRPEQSGGSSEAGERARPRTRLEAAIRRGVCPLRGPKLSETEHCNSFIDRDVSAFQVQIQIQQK